MKGRNSLNDKTFPGKCSIAVKKGDRLLIETPGGGSWGAQVLEIP